MDKKWMEPAEEAVQIICKMIRDKEEAKNKAEESQ
jgi:hypothetical protein